MRKGQKVVCVDDRYSNAVTMKNFKEWIKRDETYTVREIRPVGAEGGILLEEVKNPPVFYPAFGGHLEPAFHPRRFVPLEEFSMAGEFEDEKQTHEVVEN